MQTDKELVERLNMWADDIESGAEWGAEFQMAELREAAARITELEDENEQLRLAICGGEDAPGYAASLPLATILQVQTNNEQTWRARAEQASPAEPSGWPEKVREFIDNWFAPWGSWKTEWWEDVSRDREMTHANALLVLRGLLPPTSEGGGA